MTRYQAMTENETKQGIGVLGTWLEWRGYCTPLCVDLPAVPW